MTTHELTMNNLDDGPTTGAENDALFLNSTAAAEHARWTVIRMKLPHRVCYPIHLVFDRPHSEAAVREKIARWVKRGDRDWREFRHFDVWPTES